jgi:2-iminobutanoate/2-iminopropanoate deaminase
MSASPDGAARRAISTPGAPPAIGPYSQAIAAGDWLFLSGQIPLDPATGQMVTGDIRVLTARVLDNIRAVLEAGGSSLDKVVKTSIYLTDMSDFQAMGEVCATYFSGPMPARSTVQAAALPRQARIEIDVIALR